VVAPSAALAQDDDEIDSVSVPVVQALPGGDSERLNSALGRLGRNPRDLAALIDAGNAALGMGDADAAMGFFQRADSLTPGNAQVKAGIASAHVRREDPFTAIPLFAEAEKLGPLDAAAQLDRGLAYDLVGDNAAAQRYYRAVTALGSNAEATRRLALSLAIAGDRAGMETALSPLLQKQDKAAWRTRAFGLAALGKPDEAEAIAKSTLAPDLAVAMAAYLRYMPKLTPAQQAAAGNLGQFPRAADIGRDDPRVALYAKPRVAVAAAMPAPVASRAPTRRQSSASRSRDREDPRRIPRGTERAPVKPTPTASTTTVARPAAAAPPEVQPSRSVTSTPVPVVLAAATPVPTPAATPVAVPAPPPQSSPVFAASSTAVASTAQAVSPVAVPVQAAVAPSFVTAISTPAVASSSAPAPTGPTFDLARQVTAPSPASAPVPSGPKRGSLEEVFADLAPPSREAVPQAGAVDIRAIAARPATARTAGVKDPVVTRGGTAAAKPAILVKPSHPSRIWVQLATGRDKAALGFDWRKFARDDAEVFKGRKPFTSAFGQSTRLITGPFESQAQATAFVNQLKKAGVSGAYIWTSPAGQVVDSLASK